MGMFKARPGEMTVEEAEKLVTGTRDEPGQPSSGSYFDYLNGRIIKVNVSKDPLDFRLYDRDHGSGAGDRAIRIMLDKLTRPA